MLIIPAIDLKDGKCVRLRKGVMDDSTVFSDDPVSMAQKWVDQGARRLHLVDLNGAFAGEPVNGDVVTAISKAYPNLPIQIGGGIRSAETIEYYLNAGVKYVIIGTKAVKEPQFVTDMCKAFAGAFFTIIYTPFQCRNLWNLVFEGYKSLFCFFYLRIGGI